MIRRMKRRANEDGSIYQRADGKWVAQLTIGYQPNGTQRYKRMVSGTQQEARRRLREAQNDRTRGVAIDVAAPPLLGHIESWLETSIVPHRERKTVQSYAYSISLVRQSSLAKVPIDKLTPEQLDEFLSALLKTGGKRGAGLSRSTVDGVRRMLRAALNKALRHDIVRRNVASLSDPVLGRKVEVNPYTMREANHLLDTAIGDPLEALYTLAVGLGLRVGELLGLAWRNIDLMTGTLTVC